MKAKNRIVLLIFFTGFVFSSCQKDEYGDKLDGKFQQLVGIWSWGKTTGGIGGITSTPLSEGYTLRLELFEKGKYELYKNKKKLNTENL